MKRIMLIGLILTLLLSSVACSGNDNANQQGDETVVPSDAVAKVDDKMIDKTMLNKAFVMLALNYQAQYGPDVMDKEVNGKKLGDILERELLANLANEIVVRQFLEAEGHKVDAAELESNFQRYKEVLQDDSAALKTLADNGIDDDFIKQRIEAEMYLIEFYEQIKQQEEAKIDLDSPEMAQDVIKVEAQHILVPTLEEANQVLARLEGGESFADLAKQLSQDPGSAENGGSLGEFGKGVMVKPFEDAAFALAAGDVSEPVETQFGFHIIKVNNKITIGDLKATEEGAAELALIKSQLAESKLAEAFDAKLDELRATHDIAEYPENLVEPTSENENTQTTAPTTTQ